MLADQSPDVRYAGREILKLLLDGGYVSRGQLEQSINAAVLDKAVALAQREPSNPLGRSMRGDPSNGLAAAGGGYGGNSGNGGASSSFSQRPSPLPVTAKRNKRYTTSSLMTEGCDVNADADADECPSEMDDVYSTNTNGTSGVSAVSGGGASRARSMGRGGRAGRGGSRQGVGSYGGDDGGFGDEDSVLSAFSANSAATSSRKTPLRQRLGGGNGAHAAAGSKHASSADSSSEELQALTELAQTLSGSSSWSARRDALVQLTDLVVLRWSALRAAGRLEGCVDRLLERLDDGSVKVSVEL
jgi:hypothetical protein